MKFSQLLAAPVLCLASTMAGAHVWVPDINSSTGDFQEITFVSFGVSSATYDLVLYDAAAAGPTLDTAANTSATSLTIADLTGVVEVSANPGPFTASFGTDTASMGTAGHFELALWDSINSVFILQDGYTTIVAGNSYTLQFGSVTGEILGVDLAPIPVPAAVWLFGTGLIGLVGVARRRA